MSIRILDFDDGFSSATAPVLAELDSIAVSIDGKYYIGDETTDNSWRWWLADGDIQFEKRITGTWTRKETIEE